MLQLAKTVKSTVQTEIHGFSKQQKYGLKRSKSKHHNNHSKAIPDHVVMVVDIITVILLINQYSVQHTEKSVTGATRKTISQSFVETLMQLTTLVYESKNFQNVAFDEISNQTKHLQHAFTDLKLCNKAGNLDKVHFESVKDLSSTINQSVQLLTTNKFAIKQLGTVRLHVTHSNHTHTCLFYLLSNKCHPILGLPDLMQLGLLSFNCRISEKWEGTSDLQYYYKDDYMKFCFDSCEEQQGTALDKDKLINDSHFRSVFSGVGRFLIQPVEIKLSENDVPVQKPAQCVPVSLKGKFEDEILSMEGQGIISKLDRNIATKCLN